MTIAGREVDLARNGLVEVVVFGLLPALAYSLKQLGDWLKP